MIQRFVPCVVALLIVVSGVSAQTTSQPFASVDRAITKRNGRWVGERAKISAVFAAERRALGDRFEAELLNWLGKDVEKHYWIAAFLEADSYLHGNKRLPQLSLLVMEQGLTLVRDKNDEESQGYVVSLSINAATLSAELGLSSLAISYKEKAESLLQSNGAIMSSHVPAMSQADRNRYDSIPSSVGRPTVVADPNPSPHARVYGGVLNGRAVKLVKPDFPPEAYRAGASGSVDVSIVFDEQGKVIWAQATSGHPLLRKACEDAAWQSTFPPMTVQGKPEKVRGVLLYRFGR